ncbi:hypothetical protein SAMN04488510_10578 [Fervidobacterium changbaicum]|uniref:Mut7-C RNAse domain-containing protein n=1 Tax=Fervidobacterium changbaicum TaxID=310769 RepID=A0AAE5XBJ6_9BACT|nr:Mut7-C RNAse domain-containing protein [Fervidobacterium changbaicum]QAV33164.1 hypothetical protein CBS1_05105 [Fervidobacterium changbaicum]SDH12338.1 hypothetical protein SAMN04488510_10578 [Fervidobacterium changbaicum]
MCKHNDNNELRFLCDLTVVKLGKKLRILGFDTEITRSIRVDEIGEIIRQTSRRLITKSRNLANTFGGILVTKNRVSEQVIELFAILKSLDMEITRTAARCVNCNEVLEDYSKEEVIDKVPIYIFETVEKFKRCPKCGKVYWQGTHLAHLQNLKQQTLRRKETDMRGENNDR